MSRARNIKGLALGASGLALATVALATGTATASYASPAAATPAAVTRAAAHPATLTSEQTMYLGMATAGVSAAHAWWNKKLGWYDELLNDKATYPLASIWDSVPLFETFDEIAIAQPTAAHISAVKSFANYAEKYWNPDLKPGAGFAPYPGDKGKSQETWFDDNGWWGLAFMDAYQVTNTTAYLTQAEKAFHFIQTEGWDTKNGGMWWTTTHAQGSSSCPPTADQCPPWHSGEALAADTDLAARLYQATGDPYYLDWAETFIMWANANLLNPQGYYSLKDPGDAGLGSTLQANGQMPHDGEGAMLAALVTLCESDTTATFWCGDAERLGTQEIKWLPNVNSDPSSDALNDGPQYDAILLRGMLTLYSYEEANAAGNPMVVYTFVTDNASRITPTPSTSALYPDAWDGSSSIPGWPASALSPTAKGYVASSRILQTQAANISVFADLATVPPPT